MTLRTLLLPALLLAGAAAPAQTSLFSPSTSAPVPKGTRATQAIEVQAQAGTFSLKDEYALYRGGVRVDDPQFFLSCETFRLNLDLKAAGTNQPSTNAVGQVIPPLTAPMGGRVRSAEAHGNVVFSNKVDAAQAFANQIHYASSNDAFELTGNARFIRGPITTKADKILYYRSKGEFEAMGNVRTEGTYSPTSTTNATKKP